MNTNNNEKNKMADKKRINVYLPEALIDNVDEYAKEFGVTRSGMLGFIIKQYVDQQEVIKLGKIADLGEELKKIIAEQK